MYIKTSHSSTKSLNPEHGNNNDTSAWDNLDPGLRMHKHN